MQKYATIYKPSKVLQNKQRDAKGCQYTGKKGTIMQNFICPMFKMMVVYFEG